MPGSLTEEVDFLRLYQELEDERRHFSNYLHDQLLQDILALDRMFDERDQKVFHIKLNLAKIIIKIRKQINAYSTGMLEELSLSENLNNLMQTQQATAHTSTSIGLIKALLT